MPIARRITTVTAAAALAVVSVLGAGMPQAYAGSDPDGLKAKKAQIDKQLAIANSTYEAAGKKVQAAAAAYEVATAAIPVAQDRLADAKGAVIAATSGVHQANTRLANANFESSARADAVVAANAQVENARSQLDDVVQSAYEGDSLMQLNSLMSGGSFGNFIDRLTYMDHVARDQKQELDHYVGLRMQAKDALNRATAAQQKAAAAQAAATSALRRSKQAVLAAQAAADDLAALVSQRKAALEVAQQNKAATLAAYQKLQKESDAVEAQLKAVAADEVKKSKASKSGSGQAVGSNGNSSGASGFFIMPIHGWKSSNFGMRYDPFYHRWQLHAGVDIAAPGGTPIHAAAAGRVIRAGRAGGYGNYTCLSHGLYHGKGLATCYAHQSKILVHVGQRVKLGQTIGLVGETGAATGYHLHFEVRINGKAVQPLNWLPKCFC